MPPTQPRGSLPPPPPNCLLLRKERGLALGIIGVAQWQKDQTLLRPQFAATLSGHLSSLESSLPVYTLYEVTCNHPGTE